MAEAGRATQARGRARRRLLLDAAETLLETHQLDELTLSMVAAHAGVSKGSAYHFYKDITDLYAELAGAIGDDMAQVLRDFPVAPEDEWADIVRKALVSGSAFLDAKASRRQLIWGPRSPSHIKRSDRANDRRLGAAILGRVGENFDVPDFPRREEIFYHAVEIADLLFCLCMLDHARLTAEALSDAQRAAIAYLRIYMPAELTRRTVGDPRSSASR